MCALPLRLPLLLALAALAGASVGCGTRSQPVSPAVADGASAEDASAPRIRLNQDNTGNVVSVDVLGMTPAELAALADLDPAALAETLNVFVGDTVDDRPAVLGARSIVADALRFTPRFPLARGMRYRVVVKRGASTAKHGTGDGDLLALSFETERQPTAAPTEVAHIYPTRDRLPENQLKFYVHFSAPMGRGEAYKHVHLLDADGHELPDVFLELGEELWDPQLRRFTLLCDPARVKRGLVPREELGPVLEAGRDYTLVVDRDWPDAVGQPLAAAARKSFHVLPPDEEPINPAAWHVEPPVSGTREPLLVRFPEPLDHALLQRAITVVDAAGTLVVGNVDIAEEETVWRFTPSSAWQPGNYALAIDTVLEDLAGNAVGRAFDVDTFGPIQKRIDTEAMSLPFEVQAVARE